MKTLKTLLLLGLALVPAAAAQAGPIPTGPIHTNKLRFKIPFHFDSDEMKRLGAREIRLYVSRDRGRTWKESQVVAPEAGKFSFQAQVDGEYWFIVRTIDSKGKRFPEGELNDPGLQVIVDTTPPKLQLDLRQPHAGKVQLLWTASDEHLDLTQLRLEFLQPGSDWQVLTVVPKSAGQTDWNVPQGGAVSVRGSISDFARNTTSDQTQLRVTPSNQAVPRQNGPEHRQPVAGRTPSEKLALTMPDKFPGEGAGQLEERVASTQDTPGELGPATPIRPSMGKSPAKSSFASHRPEERPVLNGDSRTVTAPVSEAPLRNTVSGRQHVVNSKQFQIGYKLQDVGPSGVSSVELYITDDNGDTWYHYGSDDDNESPIHVEVPREGVYGFTLGVKSRSGLASDQPQNGDPPAIIVVVDQTAPQVDLLPLEPGRGKNANRIMIPWRYADENPIDKPIALSYSANGQAPWQPISGWIENTGSYLWTVDEGVPVKFFLRIEARDMAGNVQIQETPEPVVIDLARPTAKIIDVESPGTSIVPQQ